jgi:hypothetical protein
VNEIQRLAYLDAMGIDSYVSRVALPGAAPSRRLRIVRRELAQAQREHPQEVGETASAVLRSKLDGEAPSRRPKPVPDAGVETPAPAADIPIFSVAAVTLAGMYWLDEIPPGRELGPDYTQLLQAICRALGLPDADPVAEQFAWPLHNSSQLAQGEEAARQGFSGFIGGRLERLRPSGVILLGDLDKTWFDPSILSELPVVTTVSAWQMLRQPTLKSRAWSDLQVLRVNEP